MQSILRHTVYVNTIDRPFSIAAVSSSAALSSAARTCSAAAAAAALIWLVTRDSSSLSCGSADHASYSASVAESARQTASRSPMFHVCLFLGHCAQHVKQRKARPFRTAAAGPLATMDRRPWLIPNASRDDCDRLLRPAGPSSSSLLSSRPSAAPVTNDVASLELHSHPSRLIHRTGKRTQPVRIRAFRSIVRFRAALPDQWVRFFCKKILLVKPSLGCRIGTDVASARQRRGLPSVVLTDKSGVFPPAELQGRGCGWCAVRSLIRSTRWSTSA